MFDPLTPIERRVYHYLLDYLAQHTYQPSVREIGRRLRIPSTRSVAEILQRLEEKGFVEREGGRSRGVRIVGAATPGGVAPVPLFARINPHPPYFTAENRERFLQLDRLLLPTDDVFLLRATTDECASQGVLAGDLVLLSPSTRSRDGNLIAVRNGPFVQIRLVTHLGAVLSLSTGAAGEQETFLGPTDDFAVLGVVVGVIRPPEGPAVSP